MTLLDMKEYLEGVQKELPQSKILTALFTCFSELKELEQKVYNLEQKIQQKERQEGKVAEALNHDTQEDDIQIIPMN